MIGPTCVGAHHTFHLQREKQGSKRSHTDTQTDAEIVDLQVVALAEFIDHTLFLGREVGKELTLDTFPLCLCQLLVGLPAHSLHEFVGTSDQSCSVVANQMVATLTIGGADSAGNRVGGKH